MDLKNRLFDNNAARFYKAVEEMAFRATNGNGSTLVQFQPKSYVQSLFFIIKAMNALRLQAAPLMLYSNNYCKGIFEGVNAYRKEQGKEWRICMKSQSDKRQSSTPTHLQPTGALSYAENPEECAFVVVDDSAQGRQPARHMILTPKHSRLDVEKQTRCTLLEELLPLEGF